MESVNILIALITAGVSLAMGLIYLFTGLNKDAARADLVFGIMCISVFIFFILPPAGFIVVDKAPYPIYIIIKRLFNFINGALFPWFILLYSGYGRKRVPLFAGFIYLVSFLLMAFTSKDSSQPIWVTLVLMPMAITLVYGLLAARFLIKSGKKNKGFWFLVAMVVFAFFYLLMISFQFAGGYFNSFFHSKIFYPISLYLLPFMLIMGVRLREDSLRKFGLEKIILKQDIRWHSLLEHMQLIVLELDVTGRIRYINPFGVQILGYSAPAELLNKDWFSHFLPAHEAMVTRSVFVQSIVQRKEIPYYKNDVLTDTNKWIRISWTNVLVYDDAGNLNGVLSIGSNITNEENAYKEIAALKAALEKENLMLKGHPLEDGILNGEIVGKGEPISYAVEKARQVAGSAATVLLEGETGVGKELFANLIHSLSLRNKMPFIKVNCGALPAELIEDELFGHEKGAFTGALQQRKGRFELAQHGTIFLDEIGELPLALQPKLLRVLQNGEFERIGGQQTLKVDVRIISATNKDLEKEIHQGRFREDLYYRLNVFPITIPPLRNRRDDIPLLVNYFKDRKAKKHGKIIENISKADLNRLCAYSWPGNIRELKNVIERAVISATTTTLKLDWWDQHAIADDHQGPVQSGLSLEKIEKEHILRMLNECNWKINGNNGAAEKLSMHPNTLRSRMKKLNLTRSANGGNFYNGPHT